MSICIFTEVEVTVDYGAGIEPVETKMKLKRVIRYQHLARDMVDEDGYPPTQEYMLYSTGGGEAFLSHCPNRWPDFQQLIRLDEVPKPFDKDPECAALYEVITRFYSPPESICQ